MVTPNYRGEYRPRYLWGGEGFAVCCVNEGGSYPGIIKEVSMKARIYYVFLALIVVVLGIVAFSRGISKEPPAPNNPFDQLINASNRPPSSPARC